MQNYKTTFTRKRLWILLIASLVVSFSILLLVGGEIYQMAPPIPKAVVTESGRVVYTRDDIEHGQNVWQSTGGMQQGSIWGHGSYVAPDWSADWLHREATAVLEYLQANNHVAGLPADLERDAHIGLLRQYMRANTYDETTETITISEPRAVAVALVADHFARLFEGSDQASLDLRRAYAMPLNGLLTPDETHALGAFFFWTSWAASTNRPGDDITYTSNWPHEPLVDNRPTAGILLWSIVSVIVLLAGIGALVWYYVKQYDTFRDDMEPEDGVAIGDFFQPSQITPSMRATAKYFWLVSALFFAQVMLGIVTAHYAVEGQGLYGLPLVDYLPYSVTRTWHTQIAIYWIATAWLATGLYVGPLMSGRDPKFQVAGVNFLFVSLLLIVGEWAAIHRLIASMTTNFWFGHQGYEYVDLGRFWQIYLFVGLLLWVVLVLRAIWPSLRAAKSRSLLYLVIGAALAIGLLYGAGLMWGQHTNLAIMEYWRWWVVHLWVEGVFEVFATAIVSLLFVRMGLLRQSTATVMVLFATIIFMAGGVLGTFHHLYFSGTPISVIALGGTMSALEVVPLMVVGFEAYHHSRMEKKATWSETYYWPFMFFAAVTVWNMIGAGLFGFLVNPPINLYYMQGLNLTANHGHAALFGVYGMLGLGLTLYCMRGLTDVSRWNHKLLKVSFWSLNIGLAMMTFLSLLPQGVWQTYASIKHGYAYARSAEFIHSPVTEALVWARVPGDLVFTVGVAAFCWFVFQAFRPATGEQAEVRAI